MLVSLDPLIDMISLKLSQKLDDSSLELGFGHQYFLGWSCKPLFSDLDSLYWFHSKSDLVFLISHELPSKIGVSIFVAALIEDQDVSFLLELNLVQHLERWKSGIKIIVEVRNVLGCKSVKLSDLKEATECLFKCYFICVIEFHEGNMQKIDTNENVDGVIINLVALHEIGHESHVNQEEN